VPSFIQVPSFEQVPLSIQEPLFIQAKTMPHLGYIGEPSPPRGQGSSSMCDDGDAGSSYQPALAAAEEYIEQTGTGAGEEDADIVQ
jgi:hypothetical protein